MPGTNSSSGMNAGMSFSSGCPHADKSDALVAPALVRIMNSRRFITESFWFLVSGFWFAYRSQTRNHKPATRNQLSSMTNVAIDAHASCAVAIDAPTHRLIYLAAHSVHLSNLAVTRRAFEPRLDVRLVRVENICFGLVPINPAPRRLLFALGKCREFLHLGAFGHDRFVTSHARRDVRNRRVRRLVHVLVAERAF